MAGEEPERLGRQEMELEKGVTLGKSAGARTDEPPWPASGFGI